MENLKRVIRNMRRLWRAMLLLFCLTFVLACNDDNSNKRTFNPVYDNSQLSFEEQYSTSEENGLIITRDESGRVTYISAFSSATDDKEKLMSAPTSFDDIKYLFPLSEDNEIRLVDGGEIAALDGVPAQYYENYCQYYKSIPVSFSQSRIYYYDTPQGKRMTYAYFRPMIDIEDLNPIPDISEKQARQVLAEYLDVERDDHWSCQLEINEYSTKNNGKIQRDVRLIYYIVGPLAPSDPDVVYCMAPRYYAQIDAHTGQLVVIN